MTIKPVVLGGMIQRADDIGMIKHQQDAKPMMDQQNIQMQVKNLTCAYQAKAFRL